MESIDIPARYRCPDPVDMVGTVTYEEQCDLKFRMYLVFMGLGVKDGKAFRKRRIVNSFMQIYSVQFLNGDPEEREQIRGRIVADDFKIFDRKMDKATCHDIDPQGFARLTGPLYPLDATCDIKLYPRVFRKDHPTDFFHPHSGVMFDKWGYPIDDRRPPALDRRGLHGSYLCEQVSNRKRFNKLLSAEILTTCGPLKVSYAIFKDAADSYLTVKLVEWRGEGTAAHVYGTIHTFDTLLGDGDDGAKSVVFDLKRDECVSVKTQEFIKMHRPVTVVPMGQELKVEVELYHNDTSSSNNDRLRTIKGCCSFKAQSAETDDEEDPPQGVDQSAYDENQSDRVALSATDENRSDADDENESDSEDQSDADCGDLSTHDRNQAVTKDQSDLHLGGLPKTIRGDWGAIEVAVYWLPCWCRSYNPVEQPTEFEA